MKLYAIWLISPVIFCVMLLFIGSVRIDLGDSKPIYLTALIYAVAGLQLFSVETKAKGD